MIMMTDPRSQQWDDRQGCQGWSHHHPDAVYTSLNSRLPLPMAYPWTWILGKPHRLPLFSSYAYVTVVGNGTPPHSTPLHRLSNSLLAQQLLRAINCWHIYPPADNWCVQVRNSRQVLFGLPRERNLEGIESSSSKGWSAHRQRKL